MIALSTAFKKALVAVDINGKVAFKELDSNCKHSENMLVSVDELLGEIDESLQTNDCYALTVGPGSFTGVRIGIALVKGFLAGEQKKLIAFTTFDLMAYSFLKRNPNCEFTCVIDGLSGLVFICRYDKNGNKISTEEMISVKEFEDIKTIKVGLAEENLKVDFLLDPTAIELLELSNDLYLQEKFIKNEDLIPLYIRKSQAEVGLEEKIKKV